MRTALREPSRTRRHEPDDAGASDAELLARVRSGDEDAYGELYRRHAEAARRLARRLTRSPAAADDLVGDGFAAVLVALRNGSGPTEAFRAYLLTTIRRRSWRATGRREDPVDPTEPDAGLDLAVVDADGEDARLLAEAYRGLPERWQLVLWHTEVEGQAPAEVAPLLGLSPHAAAALAHRAREGLRESFLQAHLRADAVPTQCRSTVAALGALVRGSAGARARARAEGHLAGCARCRHLRTELVDVNRSLRTVVGPMVLGGAAAAYLGARVGPSASAPVTDVGRAAGRPGGRAGLVTGGLVGVAVVLLLFGTDLARPHRTDTVEPDVAASVPTPRDPAGTTPTAAAPVLPALGGVVRSVTDCADALGVGLTSAATDTGEANAVIRAVLVPAGAAGLPTPRVGGIARPLTGTLTDVLRDLVADPTGSAAAPDPLTPPEAACVRVSPSALLAGGGGPWTLLVAYLPAGGTVLDDLRFAVLGRPLALLGPTTRRALADARATLADGLRALDDLAGATAEGPTGLIDSAVGASDPGTLLAPLGDDAGSGDPGTATAGGATTPPGVRLPLDPPATVPPVTVPTLPGVTLPSVPLPDVPLG